MSSRQSRERIPREVARVEKALFVNAGQHHPQYMRPWEVNSNDDTIEDMLSNLNHNRDFDPDDLGGWSSDLIGVIAQVDDQDEALIPHGWDAERLRFFLHVSLPDRMGSADTMDFYITGFTENDTLYELEGGDLQMQDDTRLFINSVMRIRRTSGLDLHDLIGGSSDDRLNIESNSHCLVAYTDSDRHRRDVNDLVTLRPYDVACRMDENVDDYMLDSRNNFSTTLSKPSSRGNTQPAAFLGRTLKAVTESIIETRTAGEWRSSSSRNPAAKASTLLSEKDQSKCRIQQLLRRETNYVRSGYITWREACNIFDGLSDERYTTVMIEDNMQKRNGTGRRSDLDGELLGGSDLETIASYQALNSISGIMMESCIVQAHLLASSNSRGDITFSFARGTAPAFFVKNLTEEQQEENIFMLEKRLRQFVFDPLEFKVRLFDMDANMDCLGDSQIFLSVQGNKEAEFWGATFADGSTSSLITTRQSDQAHLAKDIKTLADSLLR